MNRSRRTVLLSVLVLAGAQCAFTQQAVPPPPNPNASSVDSGPSLAVTMQFIQDKLSDLGTITFNAKETDGDNHYIRSERYALTNVMASQTSCIVSYHLTEGWGTDFKIKGQDGDFGIAFKEVQSIQVMSWEAWHTMQFAKSGHPDSAETATTPQTLVLIANLPHNKYNEIPIQDPDMADRLAKAMTHAVELCGGGNKDPF